MRWELRAADAHRVQVLSQGLADLPEQVAQPEYATVVGLVLFGAKARRSAPPRGGNLVTKLKAMFAGAS